MRPILEYLFGKKSDLDKIKRKSFKFVDLRPGDVVMSISTYSHPRVKKIENVYITDQDDSVWQISPSGHLCWFEKTYQDEFETILKVWRFDKPPKQNPPRKHTFAEYQQIIRLANSQARLIYDVL